MIDINSILIVCENKAGGLLWLGVLAPGNPGDGHGECPGSWGEMHCSWWCAPMRRLRIISRTSNGCAHVRRDSNLRCLATSNIHIPLP
jgi:hypothetical protein